MKRFPINHYRYKMFYGSLSENMNPFCEENTKPSLTVPGMAMSIGEMLKRYVRGESVAVFNPVYTDSLDVPDNLERMSEFERIDLARELKAGIASVQVGRKAKPPIAGPSPVESLPVDEGD